MPHEFIYFTRLHSWTMSLLNPKMSSIRCKMPVSSIYCILCSVRAQNYKMSRSPASTMKHNIYIYSCFCSPTQVLPPTEAEGKSTWKVAVSLEISRKIPAYFSRRIKATGSRTSVFHEKNNCNLTSKSFVRAYIFMSRFHSPAATLYTVLWQHKVGSWVSLRKDKIITRRAINRPVL